MRDFTVYIETAQSGEMNAEQASQLVRIVDALPNWRINLLWLVRGNKIGLFQVIRIIHSIHKCCKGKSVIIHSEICKSERKVSALARFQMNFLPFVFYDDKEVEAGDYAAIYYKNTPKGCAFSSCLGNTIFIKSDSTLSICPKASEVKLHALADGEKIESIFDTESFKKLLISHIQRRNVCKSNCDYFSYCHGGCPLEATGAICTIQNHVSSAMENDLSEEYLEQQITLNCAHKNGLLATRKRTHIGSRNNFTVLRR